MPLRKIDFISSVLALAEPVPFTVAILMVKSLMRARLAFDMVSFASGNLGLFRLERIRLVGGVRPVQLGFLHVPGRGRAALGAQSAVHAQVLVLHHHPRGLRQRRRYVQRLAEVLRGRLEAGTQLGLLTVMRDGETVDRADIDTGVALDTELRGEHRLHVAVETALHFLLHLLRGEAELNLDVELLETLLERHVRHQAPLHRCVVVGVRPLVHAHLAALQVHAGRQTIVHGLTVAVAMDRDRRLVAVLDRPDDVFRPERSITAEEHLRVRGLEGHLVDYRHVPLVEPDAEVALNPGEGVLLADREDHIVRRKELLARDALGADAALRIELVLHLVELHADEATVLDDERPGRAIDDDLDALLLGVLELPLGGLEEAARLARHDLDALGAEPEARAAAVHGGVAHPDDEHALADPVDVPEGHRLEPGDTDVDVGGAFLTAGKLELLALRGARADEHRIEAAVGEELAHALHGSVEPEVDPHADDHRDLLAQHRRREAERGNVGAHQAAGLAVLLEDGDLVAERHEIVRDRERGAAGADAGDALAVLEA